MYEFVFFEAHLRDRFLARLAEEGVEALPGDPEVALSVGVDEDVDEAVLERLEAEYDRLLDEQARIIEAEEPDSISRVGVQFTRADGSIGVVRLDPALTRRLLTIFNYEELQAMVQQIADAADEPVRPLCKP